MKHFLFVFLLSAISTTLLAQGLTRYGQITNGPSNDFVDKNGKVWSFRMLDANGKTIGGTVSDIEDNVYATITIGNQVWMAENLKTTKYNDGTPIPFVADNPAWAALSTPGYCWYNNDIANKNTYGALYNWFAVNTALLAPTGWHVATDAEWTTLTTFLGGESIAGGKLKEAGTTHWWSPNTGATNSSGFTALPGGYRSSNGFFVDVRAIGLWWSATEYGTTDAWHRYMGYPDVDVYRNVSLKNYGFSVRCVKD